jgi:5,10-methylenetetrahydromethanopterin reductase
MTAASGVTVSCAFATSAATPRHVALAEAIGYERAFLYDSPAILADVWMQLALAAERTTRIGLGPGVLIPSLRHPLVTAAAIATLVEQVGPDRVSVGVGTGFTGRFAMGQRPLRWAEVADWVTTVRALLRGETCQWEGGAIRMIHSPGYAPPRPVEVPFLLGASGPKGAETARRLGTGVFLAGAAPFAGFETQAMLTFGTVLDDGEPPASSRVMAAAGHGVAVMYHYLDAQGGDVTALPDGQAWLDAYADVAVAERHLAIHELHLIGVNDRDRPFVTPDLIAMFGGAYTPAQLRERLAGLGAAGVTEIVYQPAGPDIERELEAFYDAAQG